VVHITDVITDTRVQNVVSYSSAHITETVFVQYILDYPVMLGNLFPKSWPDKHLAG